MTESALPGLVQQVLWAAFVLGVLFGAVAQRWHFCTMGAVADIVSMGDWSRMRMWVVAMALAILGFNAMVALGVVEARASLYAGPRLIWLSNLAGGLLFGFGMVLASGCGSKTLVRIGGGNLKSLVVFAVLAIAAEATLRGVFAVPRVAFVDAVSVTLAPGQDLPSLLAAAGFGPVKVMAPMLGMAIGAALVAFVLARPEGRTLAVWAGGAGVAVAVVGLWWVSGHLGHLAEHPVTLEETFLATRSGRMESMSFVAPVANIVQWLSYFSDKSNVLTTGIVSSLGVIAGSAAVALASGTFRWEGFAGTADTADHLVGAALMGVGGVMALGCTVGQGLSGLSTLALGSVIALAGILAGAVAALKLQIRRLERRA